MTSIFETESGAPIARRGLMLVLSSPSGAGKSTIARNLLESDPGFQLSVSVTTRQPRPGEIEGVHYHFVSDAEFDAMIEEDDFYEWAPVFGHRYGTPKGRIRSALKQGQDFLFDIDWQGTQQLFQKDQQDVVRVFILPPPIAELERRLRGRRPLAGLRDGPALRGAVGEVRDGVRERRAVGRLRRHVDAAADHRRGSDTLAHRHRVHPDPTGLEYRQTVGKALADALGVGRRLACP
mgnify:CR=1 FL=1